MALTTIKSSNLAPGSIEISDLEDSGVTAQSYGSASEVPVITVNAKGVITAATTTTVAGVTDFDYNIATGVLDIDTADGSNFSTTVTLGPFDTDDLSEGSSNLYYTDARVSNYLTTNSYATQSYADQAETDAITSAVASAQSYTDTAISNLINAAPTALNTLDELAAALGDDANFASTVTTNLAGKTDKTTTLTAGTGLSGGGDLSANRTFSISNTGVTAGTYGSSTAIPVFAVNAQGQITSVSNTSITVGDGTLTVSSGSGLTGSGTFTANQTTNGTITLSHADTSSASSVDNSNGTVIQDITLDGFGHITAIGSANLDTRYDARYLGITAKAADSDLLDGLNSSSFLHTGITSFTSSSGTSAGWKIYRDNTRSFLVLDSDAADGVAVGSDYTYIGSDSSQLKGNIAIGPTSIANFGASELLHIKGPGGLSGTASIKLETGYANRDIWRIQTSDNGTDGLLKIQDYSGGSWSDNLTITAQGNVGIGTDPSEKLHVNGNLKVSSGNNLKLDHGDIQLANADTPTASGSKAHGFTVYDVAYGSGKLSSRITGSNYSKNNEGNSNYPLDSWGWEFTDGDVQDASNKTFFRVDYNEKYMWLLGQAESSLGSGAPRGAIAFVTDDTGSLWFKNDDGWKSITASVGTYSNPADSGAQLYNQGYPTGYYWIQPPGQSKKYCYVDNDNYGGGWVLVQVVGADTDHHWAQTSDYNLYSGTTADGQSSSWVPFSGTGYSASSGRRYSDDFVKAIGSNGEGVFRVEIARNGATTTNDNTRLNSTDYKCAQFIRYDNGISNYSSSNNGGMSNRTAAAIYIAHYYPYSSNWETGGSGHFILNGSASYKVFDGHSDPSSISTSLYSTVRFLWGYTGGYGGGYSTGNGIYGGSEAFYPGGANNTGYMWIK